MIAEFNFKKAIEFAKQLATLGLFWAIGDLLNTTFHVPISAGILGMLLLLLCLFTKVVKFEHVAIGAYAVLGELLLFFLPIVVAVVQYKALFLSEGIQIVLCIFIGTISVMLSTCLTISFYNFVQNKWHLYKQNHHINKQL